MSEQLLYKPMNTNSGYPFWMAFPAVEEFALSSLGYLWLFKIADTEKNINSERICTDTQLTRISPKEVKSVAFSLSYDFDFLGVFKILEKNNIPFLSKDRTENHPLIFAGGPVITTNPEPYKKIFDFMIIGDGEKIFKKVLDILKQNLPKKTTLEELSKLEGIYVPEITKKVKKISESLTDIIYTPIISDKAYFKDTFILEVSRGCTNMCKFCTASYTNLPYRGGNLKAIEETIDLGLKYTKKIALLGAQVSAHPDFKQIINYIKTKMETEEIQVGISSLRADTIDADIIDFLVKGGQRTLTIAIEAASERLRKLINKNINNEHIHKAIEFARKGGLKGIKIYSMIGLPTESDDDINAFIELGKNLKNENKGFDIEFSFSTFVPKPQTPFQWEQREDTKSLEKKILYLEKEFSKLGIKSKFSSPKWDYWQTVLSRGGEELADFLIEVYKQGGKIGGFKTAAKKLNLNLADYIDKTGSKEISAKETSAEEIYPPNIYPQKNLPWDFVEMRPGKDFLINEIYHIRD